MSNSGFWAVADLAGRDVIDNLETTRRKAATDRAPNAAGAPEGAPTKDTPASDSSTQINRVRTLVAHAVELLDEPSQARTVRVQLTEALRLLDGGSAA